MQINRIKNEKQFLQMTNILKHRVSHKSKRKTYKNVIIRLNNLLDKAKYYEYPATIQQYIKLIGNLGVNEINQCVSCCSPEMFYTQYIQTSNGGEDSSTVCVTLLLHQFQKVDPLICAIANAGQGCIVIAKEMKQNKASKGFTTISIAEKSKIVDQIFKAYQSLELSKHYINVKISCIKFKNESEQKNEDKDEFIIRISITVSRRNKNRLVFCCYSELNKEYQEYKKCKNYRFQHCKLTNCMVIKQALQLQYYQVILKNHQKYTNQGDLSDHHCFFECSGLQFTNLDKFVHKFDRIKWNQQISQLDYLKQTKIMERLPQIKQNDVYIILHTNSQNLNFANRFRKILSQYNMTFQSMQVADIFPLIWKQMKIQSKKCPTLTFFIIRQSQTYIIKEYWKKLNKENDSQWLYFVNEKRNPVLTPYEHQMLSKMCYPGRVWSTQLKNGKFQLVERSIKINIYLLFVQTLVQAIGNTIE